jgi:head-tail adaptor
VTAGRRDQLVTLQTYTAGQDESGQETKVWGPIGGGSTPTTEWVAIFYGRGDERRQAAMEQGQQAANFQMLANLTTLALRVTDRILHGTANWDIQGIAVDTPSRGLVEVTAIRAT